MILSKNYIIEGKAIKANSEVELSHDTLNECVIVTTRYGCDVNGEGGRLFQIKHRDRMYTPNLTIQHDNVGKIERLYYNDTDSTFAEGIAYNHDTKCIIGVQNTSLMVSEDEKSDKIASKGKSESVTAKDGEKMLAILALGNFDEIVEKFKDESQCISGHTVITEYNFVTKQDRAIAFEIAALSIENEEDKKEIIIKDVELNLKKVYVRTNHKYLIDDPRVGYASGVDAQSSITRKIKSEELFVSEEDRANDEPETIMKKLAHKPFEYDSPLNPQRDLVDVDEDTGENKGMRTTAQIFYDLTNYTMIIDPLNHKSNILFTLNKVTDEIKPKLKLIITDKPDNMEKIDF